MSAIDRAAAATAVDPAAVSAMLAVAGTLDVWPGCRHPVTRGEAALVASPPFQRLRRLRQMGLAFHAWPNAENTRASHSLGVSYWATACLAALERCTDASTRSLLASARSSFDPLSLELVLRFFALLHDIDLLPLGHTLRYQSGAFTEGRGRPRLAACVAAIKASAREHAFADATSGEDRARWLAAFDAHLDAAADALSGRVHGPGRLLNELVNSGLGADLVDFALRDSVAVNREQQRHDAILQHLRLVEAPTGPRLALDVGEPAAAPERVAAADDLYRARFEIFAASVFHPTKLAADAMLDFVLRRLGAPACAALLPEARLLAMGDDELIDTLVEADGAAAHGDRGVPVGRWLRQGHLHEEAWRTEDLAAFRAREGSAEALALAPAWRTAAEQRLAERLPWAARGDLIVAVSDPAMQVKPANALFRAGPDVFTLAEAGRRGYAIAASRIAGQYTRLWSLRVYLSARSVGRREAVRAVARELFGTGGTAP
jgi:hypothetical protein